MLINILRNAGLLLFAVALSLGNSSVSFGVVVTVDASAFPSAMQSRVELKTLRWELSRRRFESVDTEWKFSSEGLLTTDLEPGGYQLELKLEGSDRPVFCRSPRIAIKSVPVEWTIEPQVLRVRFVHRDEPLGIRHLSVRSFDTRGEIIVHEGSEKPFAELITTSDTRLDVTVMGEDTDTLALGHALIEPKNAKAGPSDELLATITAAGRHWYERPVLLSPDNPPIKLAWLTLVHPRGELVVPYREGVEVVTNRPLFHLSYRLESEAGQVLVSRRCFAAVGKIKRFVLGGKLHPSGFAKVLTRLPNTKELRNAGLLTDSEGIEINLQESKIDWKESFALRRTEPLPKNPLDELELGLLGDPLDTVQIKVAWNWPETHERELKPSPFVEFRSQNFKLNAPAAWRDRAEVYLTSLEHCRSVLKRTTGRAGPKQTSIRWRLNTHNAKAQVGGNNPWMSMPLAGLYDAVDPNGHPWFMVHEMLHTFGFNHGKTMSQHQSLGNAEMSLTRWEIPWKLYNAKDVSVRSIPSTLAGQLNDAKYDRPSEVKLSVPQIVIVSARFGSNGKWVDATESLRLILKNNPTEFVNSAQGLGVRDPRPGRAKKTEIEYMLEGVSKSVTINAKQFQKRNLLDSLLP